MASVLHLSTRKGFFTMAPRGGTWEITRVDFLGQNATMSLYDPRSGNQYVSLDHGHFGVKLHRSEDAGANWTECGVPVFPPYTDADKQKQAEAGEFGARRDFSSLKEIWELVPGGVNQPGVLWAGTIPGGLFRSSDHGQTWQMVESLWNREDRWKWFGGGKDSPGIHSIAVDPRDCQKLTVAISCGGVWHTTDGGEHWESRCRGMRAAYMPPELAFEANSQDPHRMVMCPAYPEQLWVQHHNGIFYSPNGGIQWTELTHVEPSVFGLAVVTHPLKGETAWFVPAVKDECRVPVDGRLVVTRTQDGGKSFEVLTRGLPAAHCYDLVFRHSLAIDESGEWLAMGSSTGSLWVSGNGGEDWQHVTGHLPPIYCVRFGGAA